MEDYELNIVVGKAAARTMKLAVAIHAGRRDDQVGAAQSSAARSLRATFSSRFYARTISPRSCDAQRGC